MVDMSKQAFWLFSQKAITSYPILDKQHKNTSFNMKACLYSEHNSISCDLRIFHIIINYPTQPHLHKLKN